MKEIANKLNSMDGVKVIGQMGNLDSDVFLGRYWIQFTCSNKESLDFILSACTGANVICKIEEGWGNKDVPADVYLYTLILDKTNIEPFKGFMGMPHRVVGGIKPVLAKDVSWIKDLMPQEEPVTVLPQEVKKWDFTEAEFFKILCLILVYLLLFGS